MAVPWIAVGQMLLGNLDNILRVVKPAFTKRKADGAPTQSDLINQQIAELQAASTNNADQIAALAAQLKELIATFSQAADEAAAQRAMAVKLARVAIGVSAVAVIAALIPWFIR